MSDKNQTAVEWLTKILENQKNEPFNFDEWTIAFEHAKEIEKEQIKQTFDFCNVKWTPKFNSDGTMSISNELAYLSGSEYYNDTYKNA